MSCAILSCSWSVVTVLAAQAFTSGSLPLVASFWNSFTSLSWSLTMSAMYALSRSAPDFAFSLSSFALSLAGMALGALRPFWVIRACNSSLALVWSVTILLAKSFTCWSEALSFTALPRSTSSIPPEAAFSMNIRSLREMVFMLVLLAAVLVSPDILDLDLLAFDFLAPDEVSACWSDCGVEDWPELVLVD